MEKEEQKFCHHTSSQHLGGLKMIYTIFPSLQRNIDGSTSCWRRMNKSFVITQLLVVVCLLIIRFTFTHLHIYTITLEIVWNYISNPTRCTVSLGENDLHDVSGWKLTTKSPWMVWKWLTPLHHDYGWQWLTPYPLLHHCRGILAAWGQLVKKEEKFCDSKTFFLSQKFGSVFGDCCQHHPWAQSRHHQLYFSML